MGTSGNECRLTAWPDIDKPAGGRATAEEDERHFLASLVGMGVVGSVLAASCKEREWEWERERARELENCERESSRARIQGGGTESKREREWKW